MRLQSFSVFATATFDLLLKFGFFFFDSLDSCRSGWCPPPFHQGLCFMNSGIVHIACFEHQVNVITACTPMHTLVTTDQYRTWHQCSPSHFGSTFFLVKRPLSVFSNYSNTLIFRKKDQLLYSKHSNIHVWKYYSNIQTPTPCGAWMDVY